MISKLREIFKSETFRKRLDYFILGLILLNAAVMVLQCYYPGDAVLQWLDTTILVIFCIEIVVKIIGLTWKGYWSDSWNWFDFIVTMIAVGAYIQSFLPAGESTLNAIFTLRIFRGFRFFRVLKFIPHIESIINGCRRAIASTSVIVLAFLIIAFICSLITCNLFHSVSPHYFKDPITSFYSIFQLFTVEGWYEIPNAVAEGQPDWYQMVVKLFFSVLLFFGGIIGMSFINSIIIDAMASDNNDELMAHVKKLEAQIEELMKIQTQKNGEEHDSE